MDYVKNSEGRGDMRHALETLGSIVFAKESCSPYDTSKTIAFVPRRLCFGDVAIL